MAMLLLEANRLLPTDRLIRAVWADTPPPTAVAQIHICISALRRALASSGHPGRIVTRRPGYRLDLSPDLLDLEIFEQKIADGTRAAEQDDFVKTAEAFGDALALFRGEPLADIGSDLVRAAASRLAERRLSAVEQWVDARLRLGEHHELVGELMGIVAEHPLRERFRGQLMIALSRAGRQAEALAMYRVGRQLSVDELGLEPGEELRSLERAILNGDLDLHRRPCFRSPGEPSPPSDPGRSSDRDPRPEPGPLSTPVLRSGAGRWRPIPAARPLAPSAYDTDGVLDPSARQKAGERTAPRPLAVPVVPRQLPVDTPEFTGHAAVLSEMQDAIENHLRRGDTAAGVGIVALTGRAGVGKTASAVRIAHRICDRFPDGQLFAALGSATGRPAGPAEVLTRFLRALGVPGHTIADGLDARAEMYRTIVADRRILVVLDDVRSEKQVLPLLPAGPQCVVIATSRSRLPGLPGVNQFELAILDTESGLDLLRKVIGSERVRSEVAHAKQLIELCGGLPLALRIAAARLAARPHWSISQLTERLSDTTRRLDELVHGGLDVRSAITPAYNMLGEPAKALFRRLAAFQVADFAAWWAAPLLDIEFGAGEDALEELVDAHLLEAECCRQGHWRYQFPELVDDCARERLFVEESAAERTAARERLLETTLALSQDAFRRQSGADYMIACRPRMQCRIPRPLADMLLADPTDWLEEERRLLDEALRWAANLDPGRLATTR
jgi:DNA-binding SARP family transcriptional activator